MHLPPETGAVTVETSSLAGNGQILAGESSGNDIDVTAPRAPVEVSDIGVDGESGKVSIVLSRLQNCLAVRVDLDGGHRDMAQQPACQDPTTSAGK